MKLVFIHGWGLDGSFWKDTVAHLSHYTCDVIDRGFYDNPIPLHDDFEPAILIGHSLGFIHGIKHKKNWHGWVAINSFPRFVSNDKPGCRSEAELREIRMRLEKNPIRTLREFHGYIGAKTPVADADAQKLRDGLDELRDHDIDDDLKQMHMPGLVMASRNDVLVPPHVSEALAHNQPIQWHETGGHILPQSDPTWCANLIKEFVRRHELASD